MLKRSLHSIWLLTVAALFVVAVALTAARLWVPSLAGYRVEVEKAAGEALGREVSVGLMQATWRGLQPVLKLKKVTIGPPDPAGAPFPIAEIWLRLDVAHYLRHQAVRFSGVDIIGADVVLVRDAGGALYLDQFRELAPGESEVGGAGGGVAALAGLTRLSLHESSVTFRDELRERAPRRFSSVMLSLTNKGDEHRLTGHAWLPGDVGYRLELDALFSGGDPDIRTWEGRAYIKGQQLSLPSLLHYPLPQLEATGVADLRLWVDVAHGHMTAVSSELEIHDLRIQRAAGEHQHGLAADALAIRLGWQRTDEDWVAVLQMLSVDQPDEPGRQWMPFRLSLAGGRQDDGAEHLRVTSGQLALDDLWQLLPLVPDLDAAKFTELATLKPTGHINDLDVMLRRDDSGLQLDRFSVRFDDLGIAESPYTPYMAGLDGHASGTGKAGTLVLDSRGVDVTDSAVFRDILAIEELQGTFNWQHADAAYRVSSERLALVNPDMALLSSFSVTLPDAGEGARLDLDIDVESLNVGRVHHYLPAKVMSVDGVAWLDNSLVGGQVHNGTVSIHGQLDQLPFDNGEGVLEVRLPVRNATLDFSDDWTPITGLDAQVDFTGRSMDITSTRGMIRTAALRQVRARIRDLARPYLTIDGDVRGELSVMLAELGSSPLGERFGGFVDSAIASGRCGLQLDIDIPLHGTNRDVAVAGRISLSNNSLKTEDTDIVLSDIRGVLTFDDDGIEGDDLKAIVFNRPVNARVWVEPGKSDTHIRLDGKLDLISALLDKGDPLRKAISGDSDWQLEFTVHGTPARGQAANVGLRLSSMLGATTIALPAPLGKAAGSTRRTTVDIENIADDDQKISFAYGDQVRGRLLFDNRQRPARLARGRVMLGGGAATLPTEPGLAIGGQLAVLHLSDWQPWLGEGSAGPAIPVRLDLDIAELEVMDFHLKDLHLAAASAGRTWTITASGESTRGDIELTRSASGLERVSMNMQRLAIHKPATDKTKAESTLTPADMPDLQLTAAELVYDGTSFGQFDLLSAAQADNRYRIERLALSSDLLAMRLDGSWHMTGRNHRSQVDLEVTRGKMGALLDTLGYEKTIKDGDLFGTLQASWPAPPWDISTEILDGKLNILIKDGQLLDIEPGAPGRALGLLSLGRLPKRLTLDFSDFFGEGFNFERISGNFVLDQGNAYTNDLMVEGTAAEIEISGRVGLAAKDYDELVTVTPYLESSLPLAGALAGGPAVGAAVIVAEKLLDGKLGLNKMARKQYAVTGPWDAPEVVRIVANTDTEIVDPDAIEE